MTNVVAKIIEDLIRRIRNVFRIVIKCRAKAVQIFVAGLDGKIGQQAIDSFDLTQPERMNCRRGHIRGGLLSNRLLVTPSAIGQTIQSNCGAAMRSIVLGDEVREPTIGGQNLRPHDTQDLFRLAFLVLRGN